MNYDPQIQELATRPTDPREIPGISQIDCQAMMRAYPDPMVGMKHMVLHLAEHLDRANKAMIDFHKNHAVSVLKP